MKTTINARTITLVGILSALAAVLFYFPEIAIIPPVYQLDFSTLPALLGGFALGPVAGLIIVAIKDLTGLLHSSSMGVGELADFLMSGSFVFVASLVYMTMRNRKGALLGSLLGILTICVIGALSNYFILIPFYVAVMNFPLETIISMISETIPAVDSLWKLILFATIPFNLLKGTVLCVVAVLLYRYLGNFFRKMAGKKAQ